MRAALSILILMLVHAAFGQAFTLRDPAFLGTATASSGPSSNITFSVLGAYTNTANQLSYTNTTAVINANSLALVFIVSSLASSAGPTNVVGNNCTWVQVTNKAFGGGAGQFNLSVYRTMTNATTATSTIKVDFAASRTGCIIYGLQATNVNIGGANGATAVSQVLSVTNSTANPTLTLSALASPRSAVVMALGNADSNGAAGTPESGYTEEMDNGYATPSTGLYIMRAAGLMDVDPLVTQGAQAYGAIALELKQ